MIAKPREFGYLYTAIEFDNNDDKIIEDIKKNLLADKRVEYTTYDKEFVTFEGIKLDKGILVVFGKETNPIDLFINSAKNKCDFVTGFNKVDAKYSSIYMDSRLYRKRYTQYLGIKIEDDIIFSGRSKNNNKNDDKKDGEFQKSKGKFESQ